MDTIPEDIISIILKNIENIKNFVLINKYCDNNSRSYILKNCSVKWYSDNKELYKNLIVNNSDQLKLCNGFKKVKILEVINNNVISSDTITSIEINRLVTCAKLNLPNLKKISINNLEYDTEHPIQFNKGLEYLQIKNYYQTPSIEDTSDEETPLSQIMILPYELIELDIDRISLDGIVYFSDNCHQMWKNLHNLKKLRLRCKFSGSIDCLPNSLEILDLGDNYNFKIFKLPPKLKELHIGTLYEEASYDFSNLRKLTIVNLDKTANLVNFKISQLDELCIKRIDDIYVNNKTKNSIITKKIICCPVFNPNKYSETIYKTILDLSRYSLSHHWKNIQFDNGYAIETHTCFDSRNNYTKKIDRVRYGEDYSRNTSKMFRGRELIDSDLNDTSILNLQFHYFGKINTHKKTMSRIILHDVKNKQKLTYAELKNKIMSYCNGILLDILSNFECFITGLYIIELMQPDFVSCTIDIYYYRKSFEKIKKHLRNKYNAIEIVNNYYFVNGINHLIKLHCSTKNRFFSFENVIISVDNNELKIRNDIPVPYNFLTTNRCYFKGNIIMKNLNDIPHFLRILSILYKKDIIILLTNCVIKLISDVFIKHSYPEYNFSYLDTYEKYHKNIEFINILKTELLLNHCD